MTVSVPVPPLIPWLYIAPRARAVPPAEVPLPCPRHILSCPYVEPCSAITFAPDASFRPLYVDVDLKVLLPLPCPCQCDFHLPCQCWCPFLCRFLYPSHAPYLPWSVPRMCLYWCPFNLCSHFSLTSLVWPDRCLNYLKSSWDMHTSVSPIR